MLLVWKKKPPFRSPHRNRAWRFPFWCGPVFYIYTSEVQREKSTTTLAVFKFLWRRDLSQQRSHGSHLGNTYLMCDLLESAKRLKPKCFTVGKTRTCLFTKLHFQGENIPILWSSWLLFPSFIFFLSDNINIFGLYLRKQLTPAFTPDMVGHPNSGLQGAHLAPILALLLTFHVVSAKSHQFNIPLHRSKDMISPFARISATTAATSTSNNPLFTKSPPLDQGFSNKVSLSLGNTSGLLTHLLFAALEHSFQARIKLWFCQAKSRIWEQTWIPVCPRFNEQFSFKFLEYQTGRGRGHWAISHVSLPEDKAYRYFDSKISPFSFSINKM